MANKKISQLNDGTSFQSGDEAVVNRSGTNFKVDPTQFGSSINVTGTVTASSLTVNSNTGGVVRIQRQDGAVFPGDTLGTIEFYTNDLTNPGVSAYIKNEAENGSVYSDLTFGLGLSGSVSERMRITSAGNVGIGTSSPNNLLTLNSDTANTAMTIQSSNSGAAAIVFGDQADFSRGRIFYDNSNESIGFETNNLSEAMRIDSSGNVGIGTTSPGYLLHVANSNSGGDVAASINNPSNSTNGSATLRLSTSSITTRGAFIRGLSTFVNGQPTDLLFGTGGAYQDATERMRITSSGNVGIGTSNPASTNNGLDISSGGINVVGAEFDSTARTDSTGKSFRLGNYHYTNAELPFTVFVSNSNGTGNFLDFGGGTSTLNAATTLRFYTAANDTTITGSERMRIDASGNLLVGKTALSVTTEGFEVRPDGTLAVNRDGANPAYFGRLTDDGDIVQFRKDGTVVGSIGVFGGGDHLVIESNNVGLLFENTGSDIIPTDGSGSGTDGVSNLGASGTRFKDLYLSGGVYLGGTGAANLLDDYETGTWTPEFSPESGSFTALTYSIQHGTYTKIGNTVRLSCTIATNTISVGTAAGSVSIAGVPFAFDSTGNAHSSGAIGFAIRFSSDMPNIRASGSNGASSISLQNSATNVQGGSVLVDVTDLNGTGSFENYISIEFCYKTT